MRVHDRKARRRWKSKLRRARGARNPKEYVGERVVVDFVKQMPRGQPWIVYIDNYFTSVRLLHDLKVNYGV